MADKEPLTYHRDTSITWELPLQQVKIPPPLMVQMREIEESWTQFLKELDAAIEAGRQDPNAGPATIPPMRVSELIAGWLEILGVDLPWDKLPSYANQLTLASEWIAHWRFGPLARGGPAPGAAATT